MEVGCSLVRVSTCKTQFPLVGRSEVGRRSVGVSSCKTLLPSVSRLEAGWRSVRGQLEDSLRLVGGWSGAGGRLFGG